MPVDKSRCDGKSFGIHNLPCFDIPKISDRCDPISFNSDIRFVGLISCSIYNRSTTNYNIHTFHLLFYFSDLRKIVSFSQTA